MTERLARRRRRSYVALAAFLILTRPLLQDLTWNGTSQLHTIMEVVAAVLALGMGFAWLARYRAQNDRGALYVAIGLLGTALLDACHGVTTSQPLALEWLSPTAFLIPGSSNLSPLFLSVMLFLSWWSGYRKSPERDRQRADRSILATASAITVLCLLVFAIAPMPIRHPAELLSALVFLVTLVGNAHQGKWRRDAFEHWLLLSLITNVISQAVFMASSAQLHDTLFNAAHLLKISGYGLIFTGMLASTRQILEMATADRTRDLEDQRKAIELRLEQTETQYHAIVETNLEPLCINVDATLVYVNQAFVKAFGFENKTDALGLPLASIIATDDLEMVDGRRKARLRGEAVPPRYVARFERPGGSVLTAEISNAPVVYGGKQSVLTSFHDLTEREAIRKALEEKAQDLARSNAELEHFAFVASHDLQEPLRKIQAFGDRLRVKQAEALSDQGLDYLNRMLNATERMRALIENLLMYARVTTNAQPFVAVDLEEVLRDVTSDLQLRIQGTGARIETGELPTIDADAAQMRQLLQNLIGNAMKFRREEVAPVIKIRCERVRREDTGTLDNQEHCRISVEDNGIGFEEEYCQRIFQIFQRLHGRSEYEGTGIGLAISRRIVERHSGRITAQSVRGQGSTFTVTLPIHQADTEESQCSPATEQSPSRSYLPRTTKKIA